MQLTKEETLSFIEFLSQREITIVPFTRTKFSFFNGRHTIDSTDEVRRMAEFVKTHSPGESYRKGLELMKEYEPNCNHKLMPELIYREDLEEYLAGLVADEELRADFLKIIIGGEYKRYRSHHVKPMGFSDEFDLWARSYRFMPGRAIWLERFPYDLEFWLDKAHSRWIPKRPKYYRYD